MSPSSTKLHAATPDSGCPPLVVPAFSRTTRLAWRCRPRTHEGLLDGLSFIWFHVAFFLYNIWTYMTHVYGFTVVFVFSICSHGSMPKAHNIIQHRTGCFWGSPPKKKIIPCVWKEMRFLTAPSCMLNIVAFRSHSGSHWFSHTAGKANSNGRSGSEEVEVAQGPERPLLPYTNGVHEILADSL